MKELEHCILKIEEALVSLGEAEGISSDYFDSCREKGEYVLPQLEEAFHELTHEEGSAIGLSLGDLRKLIELQECRREYECFTDEEYALALSEAWSTSLVERLRELIRKRKEVSMPEVSKLVKRLQSRHGLIGKIKGRYGYQGAASNGH